MSPKISGVNRKDLVIKAKKLKIREASKLSIKGLEDAVNKAIRKRNSQKIYNKITQQLSLGREELEWLKKLCDMSDNDLQNIARLRRIIDHATMKRKILFILC